MQGIINGGMYAVHFNGTKPYEYKGLHPSIIIRTLKEKELYFCVPLTTYTKERWEKAKDVGFGCRILSSNSIARIDKLQIISSVDIKNRWINTTSNELIAITHDELEVLTEKLNSYLELSSLKTMKEYKKYLFQYNHIEQEFIKAYNKENSLFNIMEDDNIIKLDIDKEHINDISITDIKNIVLTNIKSKFQVDKVNKIINIIIYK